MNPRVVRVVASRDHTLVLTFSNGEIRRFDAKPLLPYPAFRPLQEPTEFLRARAAHGTVVWSDTIDLCPDTAYELSERIEADERGA